jgi:hypothetical protein
VRLVALVAVGVLALSACTSGGNVTDEVVGPRGGEATVDLGSGSDPELSDSELSDSAPEDPQRRITLAFAGDVHFEGALVSLPDRAGSTVGAMSRWLRSADLAMVNLESPVTTRGAMAPKEREVAGDRYWFRSAPSALDVLDRSGVDVVSVANNHGGDYGVRGLRDTLRAAADSPVAVVGIGRDRDAAFTPYRRTIKGTDVAVLAADSSFRESSDPIWGVLPGSGPGIASARVPYTNQLTQAVRKAAAVDDLVVVYLHWGDEGDACPTGDQQSLARDLSAAGADIVVGTHAHTPVGAGVLGDTYVSYGLGNFLWYNGGRSSSGVLRLAVRGDEVVADEWHPAYIPPEGGQPQRLTGSAAEEAVSGWNDLRDCTRLAPGPGPAQPTADRSGDQPDGDRDALPPYTSAIGRIGTRLQERMTGSSHDPASCPVPFPDLRRLELSYVGFGGGARTGVLVVHRDVARDVVSTFERLYEARFRVQQMRLVDVYAGDDNASMAANNTSAYNCRTVAGTDTFSDHAYGRAIDINPVQNPYVLGDAVLPPRGERFVDVDRSSGASTGRGVIGSDDVVTRAFARAGWSWGGDFSDPDFQHFSAE